MGESEKRNEPAFCHIKLYVAKDAKVFKLYLPTAVNWVARHESSLP